MTTLYKCDYNHKLIATTPKKNFSVYGYTIRRILVSFIVYWRFFNNGKGITQATSLIGIQAINSPATTTVRGPSVITPT